MAFAECVRELDVADAVVSGRWPDGAADLRDHVERCSSCADLVTILGPLLDAGDSVWQDARVPSSGVVWWRAQMRARREATRAANTPLTIAHIAGTLAALPVLAGLAMWLASSLDLPIDAVVGLLTIERPSLPALTDLARHWWVVLLAGPWLILAPMAVYFALADD